MNDKIKNAFRQGFKKEAQAAEELSMDFKPYNMGITTAHDDKSRLGVAAGHGMTEVGMGGALAGGAYGAVTGKTPFGSTISSLTGGTKSVADDITEHAKGTKFHRALNSNTLGEAAQKLTTKPILKGGAKGAIGGAGLAIGTNVLTNLGEYGLGQSLASVNDNK